MCHPCWKIFRFKMSFWKSWALDVYIAWQRSVCNPKAITSLLFSLWSRKDQSHAHAIRCHVSECSPCSLNLTHRASMSVHNKETKYDIYVYPETLHMMVLTCSKSPQTFYVRKKKIQKFVQNSAFGGAVIAIHLKNEPEEA